MKIQVKSLAFNHITIKVYNHRRFLILSNKGRYRYAHKWIPPKVNSRQVQVENTIS